MRPSTLLCWYPYIPGTRFISFIWLFTGIGVVFFPREATAIIFVVWRATSLKPVPGYLLNRAPSEVATTFLYRHLFHCVTKKSAEIGPGDKQREWYSFVCVTNPIVNTIPWYSRVPGNMVHGGWEIPKSPAPRYEYTFSRREKLRSDARIQWQTPETAISTTQRWCWDLCPHIVRPV